MLAVIAHDDIHRLVLQQRFSGRLRVAACGDHDRFRIHRLRPVEHLARFPVRDIGDRTGIDHINIGPFRKRNRFIAAADQLCHHGFCLIAVHLAAQIMKCDFTFILHAFCLDI